MTLKPHYEQDDSQSTDEAFGDDIDYSEDPSLLRSSGGDAQPVSLRDRAPHGDPSLSDRFVEGLEAAVDAELDEIEALSVEEFLLLEGIEPELEEQVDES